MRQKPLNKFRAPYLDYDLPLNLAPGKRFKRKLLSDLQRKNLRLRNRKALKRLELKENNFKKTKEKSLRNLFFTLPSSLKKLSPSFSSSILSTDGKTLTDEGKGQQRGLSGKEGLNLSSFPTDQTPLDSKGQNKGLVLEDFPFLSFLSTEKVGSIGRDENGYKNKKFVLNSYKEVRSVGKDERGKKALLSFPTDQTPFFDRASKETTFPHGGLDLPANRKRVSFPSGILKSVVERRLDSGKRTTPFKADLLERKKVSFIYGSLAFKSLRRMAKEVSGGGKGGAPLKGACFNTQKLLYLLESRLDILLFKICFFPTLLSSRQAIKNGLVKVNSATVTTPGYQLKGGDFIKCDTKKGANPEQIKQRALSNALSKVRDRLETEVEFKAKKEGKERGEKAFLPPLESKLFSLLTLHLCKKEVSSVGRMETEQFGRTGKLREKKNSLVLASPPAQTNNQGQSIKKGFLGDREIRTDGFFLSNINKRKQFGQILHGGQKGQKETSSFLSLFSNKTQTERPERNRSLLGTKRNPMKPLNVEVSYLSLSAIYLYPPQKVSFPAYIDLDTLFKSLS